MEKFIKKYLLNDVLMGIIFGVIFCFFLYFPGSMGLAGFYNYFDMKYLIGGIFLGMGLLLLQGIYKKEQVKSFYLNKIWICFIVWYFVRDFFAIVNNYELIVQDNKSIYYSISCVARLFIFCGLLFFINLLFGTRYDKKIFFRICFWGSFLFICYLLIYSFRRVAPLKNYSFNYVMFYVSITKPAMVVFLFILFHLFIKKLNWAYFYFTLLVVLSCCFYGKRAGVALAVVCSFCFFVLFFWQIRESFLQKRKSIKFYIHIFLVAIFAALFVYKMITWRGVAYTWGNFFNSRINFTLTYVNNFLCCDLFHQIVGHGDIYSLVQFPHNVLLSLLLSIGIIGGVLWLWSFVYVLRLFFRFKEKGLADFMLWVILGTYFLNSFTTGFYLYHTPIYFILYFMEYRYRGLGKTFKTIPPLENK